MTGILEWESFVNGFLSGLFGQTSYAPSCKIEWTIAYGI